MSRRLITVTAAALAAAAVAAPTASAVPDYPVARGASPVPERTTEPAALQSRVDAPAPAPERITDRAAAPVPVAGPTVVVEADEGSGFDWGSAVVGAGVALVLILIGIAAAAATTRHGGLRPSH